MSTDALVPCGGCHRHVRLSEAACPFCARPLAGASLDGVVPEPTQRLSRAGVLAFAAAFLSTACPSQPAPPTPSNNPGVMQTIYGGPPPPTPPPPTPPTPSSQDASAAPPIPQAPVYGGPPPEPPPPPTADASTAPPSPPTPPRHSRRNPHPQETPHAVPVPAYGISPRPDPGSMVTRYGAPPRPDDDG